MAILKLVGMVNGMPSEHDGRYVREYDPVPRPDAEGEFVYLVTTDNPAEARQFPDAKAAVEFWRQPSGRVGTNADGIDRPLTAFTVEVDSQLYGSGVINLPLAPYSDEAAEDCQIHLYDAKGRVVARHWFRQPPLRFRDEEITTAEARKLAERAIAEGREVRICNALDIMVFHWKDGRQLWPADVAQFWRKAGAQSLRV